MDMLMIFYACLLFVQSWIPWGVWPVKRKESFTVFYTRSDVSLWCYMWLNNLICLQNMVVFIWRLWPISHLSSRHMSLTPVSSMWAQMDFMSCFMLPKDTGCSVKQDGKSVLARKLTSLFLIPISSLWPEPYLLHTHVPRTSLLHLN